jgi:phosphate transport system substrate-binding protein
MCRLRNVALTLAVGMTLLLPSGGCRPGKNDEKPAGTPPVTILIGGSATTTPILDILGKAFTAGNPGVSIQFLPSSHTAGGIQGAVKGDIDLGAISRGFEAEEKSLGVLYTEFARDGLAFVTHKDVPVRDIASQSLRDIYAGKITKWSQIGVNGLPDDTMVVIDRPGHSSAKIVLMGPLFPKDMAFGSTLIMIERAPDANDALAKTPSAVGYTSLGAIQMEKLPLNVLMVDGVAPTEESIRSDRYPYYRPLALAHRPQAKPEVTAFIAFIRSPEGRKIIADNGFVPMF